MGMKEEIQNDLREAFDGDLADAVKPLTLKSLQDDTYDTASGTSTDNETSHDGRGVFYDFTARPGDPEVLQPCEQKLLTINDEVPSPQVGDRVLKGLEKYSVELSRPDPVDATTESFLKRLE